jgi:hypothetical protein
MSAESMAVGFGAGEGADPDAALCPPLPAPPPESMAAVLGFESSHSEVFGSARGAGQLRAQASLANPQMEWNPNFLFEEKINLATPA